MARRLNELLIEHTIITKEQLLETLKYQKTNACSFNDALFASGSLADDELYATFLAKQIESGALPISELELEETIVEIVPMDIAQKYKIVAVSKFNKMLLVAISDPKNLFVLDAVKFLTGCNIKPAVAPEAEIVECIKTSYQTEEESVDELLEDIKGEELEVLEREEDDEPDDINLAVADAPVVKLVNHILSEAVRKDASDIHIETYQKILRVRYRIDGKLVEISNLPYRLRPSIISRIKIMSDLDISEKRLPQDGRLKIKLGLATVDIRVSTLPTIYGEKVVMRILDSSNLVLDLEKLGIPKPGGDYLRDALTAPFGMILVTGPTGSGKTTTLYSGLCLLNKPDVNIMTVEDPVEYNIDGINQVNVNSNIGLTFAETLRSFLRQDPDIVMVGEIRDIETAEIAIKAALTGHLVLSTLHTNNSVATIDRLIDMGAEPFLVASSVRIIVAQRLVRKICTKCKEPLKQDTINPQQILHLTDEEAAGLQLYKGHGCPACNNTGYHKRCGLYEVLPITTEIQNLILGRATVNELRTKALEQGMRTLRMAALEKLGNGETTIEEVLSATDS
ncbi:MAG: type IV-A pilus assembly ATPase PilB [Chitinivibrionales bacterium]|nr:type IV-A pilus assembly ATPase PilB [Chitinivibrionales bacterium]